MTVVLNTTIRPEVLRGRGAVSNAVGRYEKQTRVLLDEAASLEKAARSAPWPPSKPVRSGTSKSR